jgi:hypothetical protein
MELTDTLPILASFIDDDVRKSIYLKLIKNGLVIKSGIFPAVEDLLKERKYLYYEINGDKSENVYFMTDLFDLINTNLIEPEYLKITSDIEVENIIDGWVHNLKDICVEYKKDLGKNKGDFAFISWKAWSIYFKKEGDLFYHYVTPPSRVISRYFMDYEYRNFWSKDSMNIKANGFKNEKQMISFAKKSFREFKKMINR